MADMKIDNVGAGGRTSAPRKARKASSGGSTFSDSLREAAETTENTAGASVGGVGPVGSILSVQEVSDATDGRSRGLLVAYGEDMLDRLEDIRIGLLTGAISKDELAELAQRMRQKRQESDDPALHDILDEIELRAEVEIAKLTRSV